MKKILSLVLVIAMMASLVVLAPASAAESDLSIEVTDAVAKAGDTVTLDYIVTGSGGLRSFGLLIDFDESRLENPVVTVNTEDGLASAKTIGGYPYADATVTSAVDGATIDISEGYYLGTITLTVKEDALPGDAFVRINPVPGANIFVLGTSNVADKIYDWTVIDGIVTVLDDCFSAAPTVLPEDIFDFEDGVIYGVTEDVSGDVAIPSTIGGVEVVEIGAAAFDGYALTSVIIPATVEYIAAGAFYNLVDCTDIYILNPDCELDEAAMGYEGSWRSGKLRNAAIILDADENVLLTIHGLADSTAQAYAEAGDGYDVFPFVVYAAAPTATLVVGDETVTYNCNGAEIVAPATKVNGKQVIAWNVNGALVAAGATVAVDGDITMEAVTVDIPTTFNGASVKANANNAGLRFTADLDKATYDALVELFGDAAVSHGMLIAPQAYVEAVNGAFTHAALDAYAGVGKGYLDFAINGCYTKDEDSYTLAATVTNFSASTIAKNPAFVAVAYIAIELGDDVAYVYGEYNWQTARDAKTVLANVLADADNGFGETEIGWIETWKGYFDNGSK